MRLGKKILNNRYVYRSLCLLAALYVRFVHLTSRWTVIGGEIPERYWQSDQMFILSFWHGRLMMMPYCWKTPKSIHMMVSLHRDGRMVADIFDHFGIRTVAGSSSRGGVAALRSMIKLLKSGNHVGLTPDGPRGPRMRAQDGIVTLARLTGLPILPVSYGVSRRKVLGSWDRFIFALPFSRGVFIWGEPIEVSREGGKKTLDEARTLLESRLNALCVEADTLTGNTPIEPHPLEEAGAS